MLSEGRMRRASLRHRAFDPWPRAAQPWTTQDADAKSLVKGAPGASESSKSSAPRGHSEASGGKSSECQVAQVPLGSRLILIHAILSIQGQVEQE